jgi:Tfp pilus assembly protein FimT
MKTQAYTLVELTVVIGIMAIMAAVVLIASGAIPSRTLETETRGLMADLNWAREMALATRENYTVNFNQTNRNYNIANETEEVKPPQRLTVNITSPDSLTFYYILGNTSYDGVIGLEKSGKMKKIRIYNQTGYLRLCPEC